MNRAYNMREVIRNAFKIHFDSLKRSHLKNLGLDKKAILKFILQK